MRKRSVAAIAVAAVITLVCVGIYGWRAREAGKAALRKLLPTADVFVHNNRPQVMTKLGPDYADMKQVNPKIIYCGSYGYSKHGPYGAKGISELPTIVIAPAIANALYNATGVRIFNPPMSPETVARAIHELRHSRH